MQLRLEGLIAIYGYCMTTVEIKKAYCHRYKSPQILLLTPIYSRH